eukprot:557570-Rhodomonas_salina.1
MDAVLLMSKFLFNVDLFPSQQWSQIALILRISQFANSSFNYHQSQEILDTLLRSCMLFASTMSYMPWFVQMSPGTVVWKVAGGT